MIRNITIFDEKKEIKIDSYYFILFNKTIKKKLAA